MRRTAEDTALTRDALLDAALFVFAEQGVNAARLTDIAQRAGVTRGALYHHFTDKTDLYTAVVTHSWESVTAPVWAALDTGLAAFLTTWLDRLRHDDRFRALLTITVNADISLASAPGATTGKSAALRDWRDRLSATFATPALSTDPAKSADPASSFKPAGSSGQTSQSEPDPAAQTASHVIAWMCGTALLAATDPALLPSDATAFPIFPVSPATPVSPASPGELIR
ncbi:TetR/AcrR family transcriptional regulator [Actinoplanes derwentensis]|uniref:TetR/AcrR family transcriptional regulator n=1 Tax=Actinoplanes derwentensis TaxID=113562 RepID=UPI00155F9249|nr:TetR/AcrR family transcriptional regulator [Actinoplanes derwentensis]